jgi:hypothetical protein
MSRNGTPGAGTPAVTLSAGPARRSPGPDAAGVGRRWPVVFRFEDCELDLERFELRRSGTVVEGFLQEAEGFLAEVE